MKSLLSKTTKAVVGLTSVMVLFVVSLAFQQAAAQTYTLQSYDMKVSGTSNLHDWTMKATNAKSSASFVLKANSPLTITSLNSLEFSMPVKGLKSENDLMDSRTYSTLKQEKHPNISFKLTAADITPQANNNYIIKATGNLTIAGVTRQIVMTTYGVLNSDKSITVTGKQKIKMSDWQIKPPSFMLGALKVGNEVTIDFKMKFQG